MPIDKSIKDKIKECDYDCMISTAANLRFSNENEYILAAKHLGLKVHYPILTWDNLTTKSLVLNIIDHIYVWNKLQQEYCKKIHHIKSEKIIISGSLFFEKWISHNDNINKEFNSFSILVLQQILKITKRKIFYFYMKLSRIVIWLNMI